MEDPLASEMLVALGRQIDLYRRIKRLSERQRQHIEAKDSEGLMRLLSEKQSLIAEVQDAVGRLGPVQTRWETERGALPKPARQRVEAAAEELRGILAEIVAIEDQGQAAALGAREAAGDAITRLQKGKAMHKAYGGGKPPDGRMKKEG